MQHLIELMNNPWAWYVSGPLLGLIVPLLLFFGNKQLGVSSVLRHGCTILKISKNEHFNYNWKKEKWSLLFVLGVLLSGLVTTLFLSFSLGEISEEAKHYFSEKSIVIGGYFPREIFNWKSSWETILFLLVGGVLVGFGSRYANGCTSGHAIMGLSKLKLGSLIAVVGFFVGGIIGTWLLLDNFL